MDRGGIPFYLITAVILVRGDRILVQRRPPGSRGAGKWELPGGKVEPGEDPRDALVRECHEELGCTVEPGVVYEAISANDPNRDLLLLFFTARITDGEPKPMEGNELRWVTIDEMDALDLLDADRILPQLFHQRFPAFRGFP